MSAEKRPRKQIAPDGRTTRVYYPSSPHPVGTRGSIDALVEPARCHRRPSPSDGAVHHALVVVGAVVFARFCLFIFHLCVICINVRAIADVVDYIGGVLMHDGHRTILLGIDGGNGFERPIFFARCRHLCMTANRMLIKMRIAIQKQIIKYPASVFKDLIPAAPLPHNANVACF